MDRLGVLTMPRIQINRIENTELKTYGRCLYPGEFMIVRGENRSKDLVLLGANEFDPIYTKPTENAAKAIVTGTAVLNAITGDYSYQISNVSSLQNPIANGAGFQFDKLLDATNIALIPRANTLACINRPIIAGMTPDFTGFQKTDEIALVSDLKKIGPDYANAVNIGFTQLSGTTPQTYTAPSSGYAIIYSAGGVGGNLRVNINGTVYFVGAAGQAFSHTIPLSKGDVLSVFQDNTTTTSWNFGVARFVPLKLNT